MPVITNSIVSIAGVSSELLYNPKSQDDSQLSIRQDGYGSLIVNNQFQKNHLLAREGAYMINQNPTISTGVKLQGDTTTAWVATTPSFLIVNDDPTRHLFIDYIKLIITAAGAGLASLHSAAILDNKDRYASGGTNVSANTVAPCSCRPSLASSIRILYGATASAASAPRQIGRALLRGAIPVVNDQYVLGFGSSDHLNTCGTDGTTTVMQKSAAYAPAIVAPGHSFLLYLWAGSMSTSPSCEYEIGMWMK